MAEVMACRGGCVSGTGQPYVGLKERVKRGEGLYHSDKVSTIRCAQDNPLIAELYEGLLKGRTHELLHIDYCK